LTAALIFLSKCGKRESGDWSAQGHTPVGGIPSTNIFRDANRNTLSPKKWRKGGSFARDCSNDIQTKQERKIFFFHMSLASRAGRSKEPIAPETNYASLLF